MHLTGIIEELIDAGIDPERAFTIVQELLQQGLRMSRLRQGVPCARCPAAQTLASIKRLCSVDDANAATLQIVGGTHS